MVYQETSVLVTGAGGSLGHEIIKALRLANSYRVVGVDVTGWGLFGVNEAYTVPPASDPSYIDILLGVCDQHQIQVLIPGSDLELRTVSENREGLIGAGVLPLINTPDVIRLGMDKSATMDFLRDNGFMLPLSLVVRTEGDVPNNFPLPAIVKPSTGSGGSNNVFVVQDRDELAFACRYLVRQGRAALLQEYVGTPDDEYTVGVSHTLDGKLVGSIVLRRHILNGLSNRIRVPNRTGRQEFSPVLAVSSGISQGVIDDFPEVRCMCEAIAEALGSGGPLNIQCRFVDGELYPFEINPRFSGTTHIRAMVGFNEPDILIRHHLLGEAVPDTINYKFGHIVRGLVERIMTGPGYYDKEM